MKKRKNEPPYISKNLEEEMKIKEDIAYFEMLGTSIVDNYRSPDSYVFLLFETCTGTHTVDYIDYEQKDRQVHVSFPGQIHSWNTGPTAKGHKLIISKQFMERSITSPLFFSLRQNEYPVIDLDLDTYKELTEAFRDIRSESSSKEIRWNVLNLKVQLVTALINNLVEKVIEQKSAGMTPSLIRRLNELIEQHYKTLKTVNGYAELLFISPNYLNIICQRYFNMSAKKVVDQRVVLEAKRLLQGSSMSVKEIAFDLGFSEISHFSNFIKSKTGIAPRLYKQ